ncbi:unnamed protein product [Cylindrotheca closterium]|uniref:AB hydrolase-1 domain-containing protein n=1 Tax=Cylindrotheca closterium TaxID=2856 RepID=A0AAD2G8F4_9STRA|nr:unnamed protein product [Cylindrotheca closterium]
MGLSRLFCKKEDDLSKLAKAEAHMIEYAKKFGDRDADSFAMVAQDVSIPAKALPLKNHKTLKKDLHMHHVKVTNNEYDPNKEDTPLVILHGYMNGALYFYRNIVSLSNHFNTVYSVDTLGMGLSSRKPGLLKKVGRTVEETEAFFVEALEAWRKANGISKMILAGHSIGGYIGVPYSETYPERIQQLLLLTPVGLTKENPEDIREMLNSMSWTQRQTASMIRYLFDCGVTPASFLRKIPRSRAKSMVASYVERRLPVITDPKEQKAVTNYLYYLAMVPGFGENMLNRFLRSSSHGIQPTIDRIPHLQVPQVSIIYGESDWMDIEGGIEACEQSRAPHKTHVEVYQLADAGHLMMLDNWRGFYAGIVTMVCGGRENTRLPPNYPSPTLVRTTRSASIVLSIDISLEEKLDKVAQATTF